MLVDQLPAQVSNGNGRRQCGDRCGRARDLPAGGQYANLNLTWGEVLFKVWEDSGQGPPVEMGQARFNLSFGGDGGGNDNNEDDDSDSDSDSDSDDDD